MSDTDMLYIAALQKSLDSEKAENERFRELLCEIQPILSHAIFVDFNDSNVADDLYDRITEIVGKELKYCVPGTTES